MAATVDHLSALYSSPGTCTYLYCQPRLGEGVTVRPVTLPVLLCLSWRKKQTRGVQCSAVPTYNTFHFTVPDSTDYTAPLSLHSPLPLRVVDTLPPSPHHTCCCCCCCCRRHTAPRLASPPIPAPCDMRKTVDESRCWSVRASGRRSSQRPQQKTQTAPTFIPSS